MFIYCLLIIFLFEHLGKDENAGRDSVKAHEKERFDAVLRPRQLEASHKIYIVGRVLETRVNSLMDVCFEFQALLDTIVED